MSSKPRILCVDDESDVLDALTRLLRKDFDVQTQNNPIEALKLLEKNSDFAIVVSDYRMPEMNGVEFLRRVKSQAPQAVRAILSGQIETDQVSEAINLAEIHRLILKPWDNEYLRIQMIESLNFHHSLVQSNRYRELSITDPVTGLTNHRYFQERLREEIDQALKQKEDLSLIMLDVDYFKSFNDRYGHPEGDRLLLELANRINQYAQDNGFVSRYGGEEFSWVILGQNAVQAYALAESLRGSLESKPFTGPYERPAYVTVSLGIAQINQNGRTAKDLINAADEALFQAKRQGRNQSIIANPTK